MLHTVVSVIAIAEKHTLPYPIGVVVRLTLRPLSQIVTTDRFTRVET